MSSMSSSSKALPLTEDWDPFLNKDWEKEHPTPTCLLRIKRDLSAIYNEPPPGLYVVSDDSDITIIHALITGSFDTPYEGGFFYFILRYPPDYPIRPPRVKLMTTGGGQVRFNPNLYNSGKVCLSILGTWHGPCWSPAQSLSSVLISIQSVLNEKPYHNEPGFEKERIPGDVNRYNDIIQHETLRVAVCGMLENEYGLTIPQPLVDVMRKTFLQLYDCYESVAVKKVGLSGMPMQDPFSELRGRFQYKTILNRLRALRTKLSREMPESALDSNASSPTSDMDPDEEESGTPGAAHGANGAKGANGDVLQYTCIASTSQGAGEPQIKDKSNGGVEDSARKVKNTPLRS